MDSNKIKYIPIVIAGEVVNTTQSPIIVVILNQYLYSGKGRSIHSSIQLKIFGNKVNKKSKKAGGKILIKTKGSQTIPLYINLGLPYMDMKPYIDSE